MTPSPERIAWLEKSLRDLRMILHGHPLQIKGAEEVVGNIHRQAKESARKVSEREAEIKLEVKLDKDLKNDEARTVAYNKGCAEDAELTELRRLAAKDEVGLTAARAELNQMVREFEAAKYTVEIIKGIIRLDAVRAETQPGNYHPTKQNNSAGVSEL